jgi:hypothetical protein
MHISPSVNQETVKNMKKIIALLSFCSLMVATEVFCMQNFHQELIAEADKDFTQHLLYKQKYIHQDYEKNWQHLKPFHIEKLKRGGIKVIDKIDAENCTSLCYGIRGNDFSFTAFLLKYGARLDNPHKMFHLPVCFATTVEMVKFLEEKGALISFHFMHHAIWTGVADDRLFDYARTRGIDPKLFNENDNTTLWHTLLSPKASSHPQERLIKRIAMLNSLGIDPSIKNSAGKSAVSIITDEIADIINSLDKNNNNTEDALQKANKIQDLSHLLVVIFQARLKNKDIPLVNQRANKDILASITRIINTDRNARTTIGKNYSLEKNKDGKLTEIRSNKFTGQKEKRTFDKARILDISFDDPNFVVTIILQNENSLESS